MFICVIRVTDNIIVRGCKFKIKVMYENEEHYKSLFPLSEEEKEIDKKFGIERKPYLGCIISIIGSILVWSSVYWLYIVLTS
jgi:hypothetical protein